MVSNETDCGGVPENAESSRELGRRKFLLASGSVAAAALAGCTGSREDYDESLRYSYSTHLDDDQMAVNVTGQFGAVNPVLKANRLDAELEIKVQYLVNGTVERMKQIIVPVTNKKTDWGVSFVVDRTTESFSINAKVIEVLGSDS